MGSLPRSLWPHDVVVCPLPPSRGVYDNVRPLADHDEIRGEVDPTHDTGFFQGPHGELQRRADRVTSNCNDEPTRLTAMIWVGRATNYHNDRQAMIQCERCSAGLLGRSVILLCTRLLGGMLQRRPNSAFVTPLDRARRGDPNAHGIAKFRQVVVEVAGVSSWGLLVVG